MGTSPNSLRLIAFVVACVAALAAVCLWLWAPPPAELGRSHQEVDLTRASKTAEWEIARNNLKAIGLALGMYRADCDVKPPAQRRSLSDAGLPLDARAMLSIIPVERRFVNRNKDWLGRPSDATQFTLVIYGFANMHPDKLAQLLSTRGEDLPVISYSGIGTAYSSIEAYEAARSKTPIPGLVLRLNGEVAEVMNTFTDPFEFVQR